ncbi:MAG TPA: hypothetical protein VGB47_05010, partial [Thermoanaerobaculia bacterium]
MSGALYVVPSCQRSGVRQGAENPLQRRLGLVKDRRRRRRIDHPGRPTTQTTAPNQLWTADYKGQFKTLDGRYCYRYLLGCRALPSTKTLG